MMQLSKGAGLIELIGFNEFEQKDTYKIYKPLLNITKNELEIYLQKNNLKYFVDESNFDEKYKRNFFRHNFSNKFLEEFSFGVKKSFEYLQNDLNSMNIQYKAIKKIDELEIFLNQNDDNLNIRTIDLSLKKRGILLSNAQRNEIIKQKELTISHKINISICKDYIWIAPFNKSVMDKKFKDNCRINSIPKNIRAYIFWKKIDLKDLMF
jgi:tRNA(Ile)-lysidine synthase